MTKIVPRHERVRQREAQKPYAFGTGKPGAGALHQQHSQLQQPQQESPQGESQNTRFGSEKQTPRIVQAGGQEVPPLIGGKGGTPGTRRNLDFSFSRRNRPRELTISTFATGGVNDVMAHQHAIFCRNLSTLPIWAQDIFIVFCPQKESASSSGSRHFHSVLSTKKSRPHRHLRHVHDLADAHERTASQQQPTPLHKKR